ncbi:MAG: YIP1 family protein [Pseudomonadota bacterium]
MNGFMSLVSTSVTRPGEAARALLDLQLSRDVAWMLLALSVIGMVILTFVFSGGEPIPLVPGLEPMTPMIALIFQGSFAVITGYAIYFTGNAMDGAGTLTESILVVAWLQVLQVVGLVIQGGLLLVSPGIATMVSLVISFGLLWVLLAFVDVLHGFGSLGRAALLLLFVIVGIMLGLTLILGLIGVGV